VRILIDIGHPGHVHYFKNLIIELKNKGHDFIITARDKEVTEYLLLHYKIPFISRGKGKASKFGKISYMLKTDIQLLRLSIKHKPDIYLSFCSPYAAQVARLLGKPHIAINDTEHTDRNHKIFTYPFSKVILTPQSYKNEIGPKQIRFKSVVESLYIQPKYFKPNIDIFNLLNIRENEPFVLLRFVSWKAHHDYGQSGLDIETKRELVKLLSKKYKVFISGEENLPEEFVSHKIDIPPERMHDVLQYASMLIGESGTMASEASLMGTPTIYINSLPLMCYLDLEQEAGILKHFNSSVGVLEYVKSLLSKQDLKESTIKRKNELVKDFIDSTAFLIWFVENYPESVKTMKENPDFQNRFK
jgi:predicted glycosyltransferase